MLRPFGGFIDIKCMWYLSVCMYMQGILWGYISGFIIPMKSQLFICVFCNSRGINTGIIGRMSPFSAQPNELYSQLQNRCLYAFGKWWQSNCYLALQYCRNSARVTDTDIIIVFFGTTCIITGIISGSCWTKSTKYWPAVKGNV